MQSVAIVSVLLVALVAASSANIVLPEGVRLPHACDTVRCQTGFRCIARQNPSPFCALSPCPGIPRCVPTWSNLVDETGDVARAGSCPSVEGMMGICAFTCQSDSQCESAKKCCSTGCGSSCMTPV